MNCLSNSELDLRGEVLARQSRRYRWIIIGTGIIVATTLTLTSVGAFDPAPVLGSCIINHNGNTFQSFATVDIVVDSHPKMLPAGIGKTGGAGECIGPIHSEDGKTNTVIDNSTGTLREEIIEFDKYHIDYYQIVFDPSVEPSEIRIPRGGVESYTPFMLDNFRARLELTSIDSSR